MSDEELFVETQETLSKLKKKRQNKNILKTVCIFIAVFIFGVAILLYLIKTFSPDIDVSIGNSQSLTLNDDDMNLEIKSVDERLKWIQMEDDMPSVAVRGDGDEFSNFKSETTELFDDEEDSYNVAPKPSKPAPKPTMKEINKTTPDKITDFRAQAPVPKTVVPLPKASITKVYLGNYSSLDEAMLVQQKISAQVTDATPFIRAVDNYYIVQLGSFSTKERAESFIIKLKSLGYNPKVKYIN